MNSFPLSNLGNDEDDVDVGKNCQKMRVNIWRIYFGIKWSEKKLKIKIFYSLKLSLWNVKHKNDNKKNNLLFSVMNFIFRLFDIFSILLYKNSKVLLKFSKNKNRKYNKF